MNPIQAMSSILPPVGRRPPSSGELSGAQRREARAIISRYDATRFSDKDSQSMRTELREAGVVSGEDLKGLLSSAGFDVAGKSGSREVSGLPPFAHEFAVRFQSGRIQEGDIAQIREELQSYGPLERGILFDQKG